MLCKLHGTLTFMTEAFRLVSDVQHLNHLILLNELIPWSPLATHFVTKAMPIDSRCCIKKLESSITYITSYSGFVSISYSLGGGHTHTHTHNLTQLSQRDNYVWDKGR